MTNYEDVEYDLTGDEIILITLPIKLSDISVKTCCELDRDGKGLYVADVSVSDDEVTVKGFEGADIDIVDRRAINEAVKLEWLARRTPCEHRE